MTASETSRFKNFLKRISPREWKVFSICMSISLFLWIFQSLGRTYTSHIIIDLEYSSPPSNKAFSKQLPHKLDVVVRAQGWDLLSYNLRLRTPVFEIDLTQVGSQSQYTASNAKKLIIEKVSGLTDIISIQPEVIDLHLEEAAERRIPIKARGLITYANGFDQSGGIILSPKDVLVSGPKSTLAKIDSIRTKEFSFENKSSNIQEVIALNLDSFNFLKFDTTHVQMQVQVEKLTEKQLSLPILVKGYNGNKNVNLIPQTAQLSMQLTLSNFAKVDKNDFVVYVDFPKKNVEEDVLEVKIEIKSELVKNVRVSPRYIDYFLE